MTPYPEYKPTGLPWLPQIPKHWVKKKNKYILQERCAVSSTGKEQLLSLSQYNGITPKNLSTGRLAESLVGYRLVKQTDIVMNIMLAWNGSTAISMFDGIISPAYAVFYVKDKTNPKFLHYLFKTPQMLQYFKGFSSGIIESRLRLYPDELGKLFSILPPLSEQVQIVRYLDAMTAKINKLIQAKKKEIALLQEQKRAIINHAVTKGLNPNAEMKDSGIDWLGKIPAHWTLNKLGHFYHSVLGKMLASFPQKKTDSYEKYLCAKDVHFGGIDFSNLKHMWFSPEEKKKYTLVPDDLLVVEGGAGAGGAAVFLGYSEKVYIQNSIHLVKARNKSVTTKYLYYWLYALVGRQYVDFACNKATIPHLTGDKLFEMPYLFIPLKEQKQIVDVLDNLSLQFAKSIVQVQTEITLLSEYKNSLISSVVTGQIDVRNIVVEDVLPDDFPQEDMDFKGDDFEEEQDVNENKDDE